MAEQRGMPTSEELAGRWDEIKGSLREKWGELAEDELEQCKGRGDELLGYIERKTGAARADVEEFLRNAYEHGAGLLESMRHRVGEYGARLREGYRHVSDGVTHSYEQAEEVVRRRPAGSVAMAFGAGLLVGLLVGWTMRSR